MTIGAPARATARTVLRIDAALDTAIAVACLLVATTAPAAGPWARPHWLGLPALLVLAVVLIGLAAGLLWLAGHPTAIALTALGAGNGLSAVVLLLWAVLAGGIGAGLLATTVVAAVALAAVATAQLRAARRL